MDGKAGRGGGRELEPVELGEGDVSCGCDHGWGEGGCKVGLVAIL